MYNSRKLLLMLTAAMLLIAAPAYGDVLSQERQTAIQIKAVHHLRAGTIVHTSDLLIEGEMSEAAEIHIADIIGMETKRNIYAGKTIKMSDLGPPTAVERNAIVKLEFIRGPLLMTTDGRALDAGAVGDTVRVMNLSSKIVLSAIVISDNKVKTP